VQSGAEVLDTRLLAWYTDSRKLQYRHARKFMKYVHVKVNKETSTALQKVAFKQGFAWYDGHEVWHPAFAHEREYILCISISGEKRIAWSGKSDDLITVEEAIDYLLDGKESWKKPVTLSFTSTGYSDGQDHVTLNTDGTVELNLVGSELLTTFTKDEFDQIVAARNTLLS